LEATALESRTESDFFTLPYVAIPDVALDRALQAASPERESSLGDHIENPAFTDLHPVLRNALQEDDVSRSMYIVDCDNPTFPSEDEEEEDINIPEFVDLLGFSAQENQVHEPAQQGSHDKNAYSPGVSFEEAVPTTPDRDAGSDKEYQSGHDTREKNCQSPVQIYGSWISTSPSTPKQESEYKGASEDSLKVADFSYAEGKTQIVNTEIAIDSYIEGTVPSSSFDRYYEDFVPRASGRPSPGDCMYSPTLSVGEAASYAERRANAERKARFSSRAAAQDKKDRGFVEAGSLDVDHLSELREKLQAEKDSERLAVLALAEMEEKERLARDRIQRLEAMTRAKEEELARSVATANNLIRTLKHDKRKKDRELRHMQVILEDTRAAVSPANTSLGCSLPSLPPVINWFCTTNPRYGETYEL
jgi:hypothetical protein